jgi:hypothetical protein
MSRTAPGESTVPGFTAVSGGGLWLAFGGLILFETVLGCATVDVVPATELHGHTLTEDKEATPIAHVQTTNWGWYLFKFIPLATGNLEKPGYPQWPVFFTDNVTTEHVVRKTTAKAEELGGTILTDLRSTDRSAWQPWSLILWLNEIEVSGNVSKK